MCSSDLPVFAAVAEPFFSARAPWRTPRFQPKRKAEQPCRPSSRASVPEPPFVACLRVVFPPFHCALHQRHRLYVRCLSTCFDLAYFRVRARASVFVPCAMANTSFSAQTQGRTAQPPVVACLRVVFPPFHRALHPRLTPKLMCKSGLKRRENDTEAHGDGRHGCSALRLG